MSVETISLEEREEFLYKNVCLDTGARIVLDYGWRNITILQLAEEIFTHAVVYYLFPGIRDALKHEYGINADEIFNELIKQAKTIELANALDTRSIVGPIRYCDVYAFVYSTLPGKS